MIIRNAQYKYIASGVVLAPLLPLLALQGKMVRKRVPLLPEAELNKTGFAEGTGKAINIVALGESTFAGVGVKDHKQGVIGRLAHHLSDSTGKKVNWNVLARSGYTIKDISQKLVDQLPDEPVDLIVLGLGANDTFALSSPHGIYKDVKSLLSAIRKKKPNCPIVIAHLPPLGLFPAFPFLLKFVMGNLISLNASGFRLIQKEYQHVYFVDEQVEYKKWVEKLGGKYTIKDFFSDGIHPSPLTYDLWAQELCTFIKTHNIICFKGEKSHVF